MSSYYDNQDELSEAEAYMRQLRAQDDRSCAIMIAARIESLLECAIDQRLIQSPSNARKGFSPNFANTINLGYRLGILHRAHSDALHALRRIRNKAAHFDEPMSFEDHPQDVEEFYRPWLQGRAASLFHPLLERELNRSPTEARARFLVAAFTFIVFYKPLAKVVPRIDRLHWLRTLDV